MELTFIIFSNNNIGNDFLVSLHFKYDRLHRIFVGKQHGNDSNSCLDSLIDNSCLKWDYIIENDIFVNNDDLNIDYGIFNASIGFTVIHDNYWSTFNYTIQGYGNNSKELSILRDNQAEGSNMFDLSTTGINSNWPWTYLQIKDLTYYPYHGLNQRMIYRYANDIVTFDNVVIDCSTYDGDSGSTSLVYMDGVHTNYGGQNSNLYVKDLDIYDCVRDYTMFNVRWNVDIYFANINIGLCHNIVNYYNNDDINFKFVYIRDNTYVKISDFYIQDYHASNTTTLDRHDLSELTNITMQGVYGAHFLCWYISAINKSHTMMYFISHIKVVVKLILILMKNRYLILVLI